MFDGVVVDVVEMAMQVVVVADEVVVEAVLPDGREDAAGFERPGDVAFESGDDSRKIGIGRLEQPVQVVGQDDVGEVLKGMFVVRAVHRCRNLCSVLDQPGLAAMRHQGDEYRTGLVVAAVVGHGGQRSTRKVVGVSARDC